MTKRNFDDFIKAYIDYSSGHEATKKIHIWTCLSMLAAAMERKIWMDRGYYTLFPNLFVFIVGKSGIIKKSTSTGIGVDLLREIESINLMSERITAAALIGQMENSLRVFEHEDKMINQSAVCVYASELSVFLGEVFGNIIELLTTFYDCVPQDSEKPWKNTTKHQGENKIYGPCLNILGASTMTWLKKHVPDSEMEGGFASRVLFVVEDKNPERFVAWPELKDDDKSNKIKLIEDLKVISETTGPFSVEPEAKKFFENWYVKHMSQDSGSWCEERFSGYMGRKGDHILKLAMIRSISLSSNMVMTESHIKWALGALNDIEPGMFSAFNKTRKEKAAPTSKGKYRRLKNGAYDVRDWIRERKVPASKDLIMAHFAKTAEEKDINSFLCELVGMDELDLRIDSLGKEQYEIPTVKRTY